MRVSDFLELKLLFNCNWCWELKCVPSVRAVNAVSHRDISSAPYKVIFKHSNILFGCAIVYLYKVFCYWKLEFFPAFH